MENFDNFLVGVVMPYHSGMGPYLERAINGVASQGVPVVLYLVGNNPDRKTQKLADAMLKKFASQTGSFWYEHIFEDENQGVAYARNLALEYIANDEENMITHVAFCDSDDVWHPEHLKTHLIGRVAKMTYSDVVAVDEDGKLLQVYGIPYYEEFDRDNLLDQNFIFMSSVVLDVECSKFRFDHSADPMGDWDYWLHVSDEFEVSHIKDVTLTYLWKTKSGSYYNSDDMRGAWQYVRQKFAHQNLQGIDGWLSRDEGKLLRSLGKNKVCLEIGSYKGKSACCIAKDAMELVCVDTFECAEDGQTQGHYSILPEFKLNTIAYKEKIRVLCGDSKNMHVELQDDYFDFMFLDAMHDYDSVKLDLKHYLPKMKSGSIIALHDYANKDYPGVMKAANEILGSPKSVVDSIAVYEYSPIRIATTGSSPVLVMAPFARPMINGEPNPKNPPIEIWIKLVELLREAGIYTIQIGEAGEKFIGADEVRLNLTHESLRNLVSEMDSFVSVDTFFQHFATYYGKKGVVIFSQSDPKIFGHFSNVNLLKSRDFLRKNQYWMWTQTHYDENAFVTANQIFDSVMKLVQSQNI